MRFHRSKLSQGLSLVELMISLGLSALFLALLIAQYGAVKSQYQKSSKRMAEALELEFISTSLRESIRAAGFTPCLGLENLHIKDKRPGFSQHPIKAIDTHLPGKRQGLQIARMGGPMLAVFSETKPGQSVLKLPLAIPEHKELIIADCFHAEIHSLAYSQNTGQGQSLSLEAPLEWAYARPFYIGEWIEEQFFIAKNREGKNALFYKASHPEALTSQVVGLSVNIEKPLVHVKLVLKDGKERVFLDKIRTP